MIKLFANTQVLFYSHKCKFFFFVGFKILVAYPYYNLMIKGKVFVGVLRTVRVFVGVLRAVFQWVISHTYMSHVTHINKSCHVTHVHVSCHTLTWVMPHTYMSHATHTYALSHTWVMCHVTYMRHVPRMNQSVIHIHVPCHIRTSPTPHIFVGPCPVNISHGTQIRESWHWNLSELWHTHSSFVVWKCIQVTALKLHESWHWNWS